MNLLIIHEYFTEEIKSGANIIAYNNYYLMKENDINCFFFANNAGTKLEKQNINKYFPQTYIKKNPLLFRLRSLYNFEAKRNLEKVIKEVNPDLVHIHALVELSYSVIDVLNKYKIPYIITVHDAMYVCPVMGTREPRCLLCSDNIFNCIKHKCSRNNYINSLYMAFKFFINKKIIKNYEPKAIIAPSSALNEYIEQTRFSKNVKHVVIPNYLDKDFEKIIPKYTNNNYFLFVGYLADIKGVKLLLEVMKNLPKDINLHIVGEGKQKQEYEQFVKSNNLKNIKFTGNLNRQEIIKEYQDCIAVIVPSIWFEIFGMINIEAFVNGKPVIGSNAGAIPEIVEHNKTGLIFDNGNAEALKKCILKYWNNQELAVNHGKNAYKKAKCDYTHVQHYQKLNELYSEIMKEVQC